MGKRNPQRVSVSKGPTPKGCLLVGVVLGALTISLPASAQRSIERGLSTRAGWLVSFDVEGRWIPHLPAFAPQQALIVDGKGMGTGELASPGAASMAGVNAGIGFTVNDRWVFPLTGVGFASAVGPLPRVWTQQDGVPIEMKLWTLRAVSIGLPGAGLRFKHRRWSFQATLNPSLRAYWMGATAGSQESVDLTPYAMTLSIAGQLETCRRFDPINRGCLLLSPTIYEGRFGNGGAIGFRWEFGP